MVGYRKNEAATKEAIYCHNGERYFRSGDLGQLVDGKFLKLTGRIKEQFKLENGKFVVPAPMEDILMRSPYIAQVFIYGLDRPHTVALLVPDFVELRNAVKAGELKDLAEAITAAEQAINSIPTVAEAATLPLFKNPAFQKLITSEVWVHL